MRRLVAVVALALLIPGALHGQKVCKKGKPCGNSCIAQSYTCHVGESPTASQPLMTSTSDGDWVGSIADSVYFKTSCEAAKDLASSNRRYFTSETAAKTAGFRRSRVKGC